MDSRGQELAWPGSGVEALHHGEATFLRLADRAVDEQDLPVRAAGHGEPLPPVVADAGPLVPGCRFPG
jgi:hypothetical protein